MKNTYILIAVSLVLAFVLVSDIRSVEPSAKKIQDANYIIECDHQTYHVIGGAFSAYCNVTVLKSINDKGFQIEAWLTIGDKINITQIFILNQSGEYELMLHSPIVKGWKGTTPKIKIKKDDILQFKINFYSLTGDDKFSVAMQDEEGTRLVLDPDISTCDNTDPDWIICRNDIWTGSGITSTKSILITSSTIDSSGQVITLQTNKTVFINNSILDANSTSADTGIALYGSNITVIKSFLHGNGLVPSTNNHNGIYGYLHLYSNQSIYIISTDAQYSASNGRQDSGCCEQAGSNNDIYIKPSTSANWLDKAPPSVYFFNSTLYGKAGSHGGSGGTDGDCLNFWNVSSVIMEKSVYQCLPSISSEPSSISIVSQGDINISQNSLIDFVALSDACGALDCSDVRTLSILLSMNRFVVQNSTLNLYGRKGGEVPSSRGASGGSVYGNITALTSIEFYNSSINMYGGNGGGNTQTGYCSNGGDVILNVTSPIIYTKTTPPITMTWDIGAGDGNQKEYGCVDGSVNSTFYTSTTYDMIGYTLKIRSLNGNSTSRLVFSDTTTNKFSLFNTSKVTGENGDYTDDLQVFCGNAGATTLLMGNDTSSDMRWVNLSNCTSITRYDSAGSYYDSSPPVYSNWGNNGTNSPYGTIVKFNMTLTDQTSVATTIFAHNLTGTLTNETPVSQSGSNIEVVFNMTVNLTKNNYVCGQFWFNDTLGFYNQTNLSCFTVANTIPSTPTLFTPTNLESLAQNYSVMTYNSTDADNATDTIYWWIYADTNADPTTLIFNGSGYGNSTYNWTKLSDGTYYWKVKAGDGEANSTNSSTFRFTVSTLAPAITLYYPANAQIFATRNITLFNFTASDSDGLSTCQLWHNLSGTWQLNQSTISPSSGVMFTFNQTDNVTDLKSYVWNVWCNDTLNQGTFAPVNYTFDVDTVPPVINGLSLSATSGVSVTIYANCTNFFPIATGYPYVAVNHSTNGYQSGQNYSMTLVAGTTNRYSKDYTANPASGTFKFSFYCTDSAGNSNSNITNDLTFTYYLANLFTGGGGGGGGSAPSQCFTDSDCADFGTGYTCIQNYCIFQSAEVVCNYNGMCEPERGETMGNCGDKVINNTNIIEGDCRFDIASLWGGSSTQPAIWESAPNFLELAFLLAVILVVLLYQSQPSSASRRFYKKYVRR